MTQSSPIDIWIVPLDPPNHSLDESLSLLSEFERTQADRFKFHEIQRRYVMAHAGLRRILALYTLEKPETIIFEINVFGKPALTKDTAPGNIQFNLSHSGELALVAVVRDRMVGIDVEVIKPLTDHLRIAKRYFSKEEIAALKIMDPSQSHSAFIQLWTGKEAFIKARGYGLNLPLDQFSLETLIARPHGSPCTVTDHMDGRTWWVSPLPLESGYSGSVCLEGTAAAINYQTDR